MSRLGGVGRQLGAEHSQRLEAYFHAVPGIKIVAVSTPTNAKGLMKAAIRDNNPVLYLEHKFLYRRIKEELPADDYVVELGKARVAREGRHVSVITYAAMLYVALEAAEAAVFDDPVANAALLSGSGGRRAITCHQLHDSWLSFERQWQAVP